MSDLGTGLMIAFSRAPCVTLLASSHFTPVLTVTVLRGAMVLEQPDEAVNAGRKRQVRSCERVP